MQLAVLLDLLWMGKNLICFVIHDFFQDLYMLQVARLQVSLSFSLAPLLDYFMLESTACLVDTPVISFYGFNARISAILKPLLLFAEWVFWFSAPSNWEWER